MYFLPWSTVSFLCFIWSETLHTYCFCACVSCVLLLMYMLVGSLQRFTVIFVLRLSVKKSIFQVSRLSWGLKSCRFYAHHSTDWSIIARSPVSHPHVISLWWFIPGPVAEQSHEKCAQVEIKYLIACSGFFHSQSIYRFFIFQLIIRSIKNQMNAFN